MKKRWYIGITLIIYTLLVGLPSILHSVWLDEAQAWSIARDVPFFSMFSLAHYEGNGMLWHMILYPITHSGLPVISMQILNFLFALGTVFLILKYSPFSKLINIAVISGYFFVFEYAFFARNYQISVFVLVIIAVLYKTRFTRPWRFTILLTLLAFINFFAAIIAGVLMCMFLYEGWKEKTVISKKTLLLCGALVLYAGAVQFFILLPTGTESSDFSVLHTELSYGRLTYALLGISHAFLPIPITGSQFWNSSLVVNSIDGISGALLPLFLWTLSLLPFIRQKRPLTIYIAISTLISLFFYLKYTHYMRHDGFIYIAWLFTLWISTNEKNSLKSIEYSGNRSRGAYLLTTKIFICTILLAHIFAGAIALYQAYTEPNANERVISEYIDTLPANIAILVYPDTRVPALSAYTAKTRNFYCIKNEKLCTYVTWTFSPSDPEPTAAFLRNSILKFVTQYPNTPYYVIIDHRNILETLKLPGTYHLVNSIDRPCITIKCSMYVYAHSEN